MDGLTKGIRPYLLLSLLCLLAFLPGLASIPPTDRDEARFMQATRQMIETGDYINIRFQNEPRNKKPAGIHWLQSVPARVFGDDVQWPYRLPSFLGALLAVLMACRVATEMFGARAGLLTGAIIATSFMVVVEAHIAKTDAMLLGLTTAAMACLAHLYLLPAQERCRLNAIGFWLALAAGFLIKGPVSLIVAGVTGATLVIADKRIRWLEKTEPFIGVPLFLAITLPWYLASSTGGGNNFVMEALRGDVIPKLIGGQEGHGAPPGTHLLAGLITAWPWSLLVPFALVLAWQHRAQPEVRFCLAWLVPTWLLFELIPTKLPHYILPTFPAVAVLVACTLEQGVGSLAATLWGRAYRALWVLVTVALGGLMVAASFLYGGTMAFAILAAAIAMMAAIAGTILFTQRDRLPVALAGLSILFLGTVAAGVVPRLNDLALSPRLAAAVNTHRAGPGDAVALSDFSEPSAVFLLGTNTQLTDVAGAARHLLSKDGALAVASDKDVTAITEALARQGRDVVILDDIVGYNYSRGKAVHLHLLKAASPPS